MASFSVCRLFLFPLSTPLFTSFPKRIAHGCADLRLAVVSPFVDRRNGTERALAEVLERLARNEHCEIHLYAQRVKDLVLAPPRVAPSQDSGAIIWHKVPALPGPHLLQFLAWLLLNSICRAWDQWIHGLRFDLVLSPGINCLDADVVIVHALFRRLQELANEESHDSAGPQFLRRLHRRAYYALLRVKGLETVLRALSALRELPLLVIAAGDDSPNPFFEIAMSLGISGRCRFEPSRQDVLDFYAAADLYVSPSHEDSFGLPVAEAMACGLPAITSIFAGVSSLLHDGVDSFILRDPRDAKTLATMIRTLYEKAEWRGRIGQAAAKASLQWTWDRNAAAVWQLLKDTAGKKLPRSVQRP